jgi:hypothetical protein
MANITIEEIKLFYEKKGISGPCNVCGQNQWTLIEPPEGHVLSPLIVKINGDIDLPPPTLPILTLACTNCFNLRSHALVPIQAWLENNPPETSESKK